MKKILLIDDNIKLCKTLSQNFKAAGYHCYTANDGSTGLEKCLQYDIKIIILDVMLGTERGIDILRRILSIKKDARVIMLTAYGTVNNSVEALKVGAFDYLEKPVDFHLLLNVCNNAILSLNSEDKLLSETSSGTDSESDRLITQDPGMENVLKNARLFGMSDIPILILGESGTGKELIVDYIHSNSIFKSRRIEKINCAAFPDSLLDNELFGHEKGAYTGASEKYIGVFERANHSTLFLDEIGDMPQLIQAKILRTIQNKELRRLGGSENINVSVRFIAASNKNLEELVREGKFREDLYYRLSASVIKVPPLRERRSDIPLLIQYFLKKFNKAYIEIDDTIINMLESYNWPGNVRELKNCIQHACALCTSGLLMKEHFPSYIQNNTPADSSMTMIEENEIRMIERCLRESNYNKREAAAKLGISRSTLYNKMEKYDINLKKTIG